MSWNLPLYASESNVVLDRFSGVILIPTAFSWLWITWTDATQSEYPPMLMILNDSGLPDFVWNTPPDLLKPAFCRIETALPGLYVILPARPLSSQLLNVGVTIPVWFDAGS